MQRRSFASAPRPISEINLTPLMDLTFILLITFIITFPLLEQGIPVSLPTGAADDLPPDRSRTITIDQQGEFYLDDLRITSDALAGDIQVWGQTEPDLTIYVRADEKVPYGRLVEVMRMLHAARITRMALVTQPDAPQP